jgi:hypothetical protein
MSETILLGRGHQMLEMPRQQWEAHLAHAPQHTQTRFRFMTGDHQAVRYFVVRELPRRGKPLAADLIARELDLPLDRTQAIIEELEQNLFFLVRRGEGAVSWAFPVTVDRTPHPLTFSTGEQTYAA